MKKKLQTIHQKSWMHAPVIRPSIVTILVIIAFIAVFIVTKYSPKPASETSTQEPKLLLLGIDGADWNIINPLLLSNEMPNFKKLIEEGVSATPKTINPTISPLIWTTAATGKISEKHGIRNFIATAADYEPKFISSDARQVKALWNIFNDQGWKTGLFSWWATWPVERIKGYVVTDLSLLDPKSGINPPELQQGLITNSLRTVGLDLLKDNINFNFPTPTSANDPVFFKTAHTQLDNLDKIFLSNSLYAFDRYHPDVVMQIFGGIDATQHLFLKFHFPEQFAQSADPNLLSLYKDFIKKMYIHQDELLGEYLKRAGPKTNIIIMSDHGVFADQTSGYRFTKFNTLLSHLGLLTYTSTGGIDYSKTIAFECNNNTFDWQRRLCLNLKGRFSNGSIDPGQFEQVRQRVIKALSLIRTTTGEPLFISVSKSTELTSDVSYDIRRDLPDAVILVGNTYRTVKEYLSLSIESGNHYSNPEGPDGIFIWKGPNIKKDHIATIGYTDIAPNILYALGLPIAKDMDGTWLPDLFVDPKQPTYIETYESGVTRVAIPRVESLEEDDSVLSDGLRVHIQSVIKPGDLYDRACFNIPKAETYAIETETIETDQRTNISAAAWDNPLITTPVPFKKSFTVNELPIRNTIEIPFSSLTFSEKSSHVYSINTPLALGKESFLGIWTKASATLDMPSDGFLHIVARATPAHHIWPELHIIQSDTDERIQLSNINGSVYTIKLKQGQVQLSYDNDMESALEDRNIYIQRLYVDQQVESNIPTQPYFDRENQDICFTNTIPGTTETTFRFTTNVTNSQNPKASSDAMKYLEEIGDIEED